MACSHDLNGVKLTEQELYELEMEALRDLELEKSMYSANIQKLASTDIIKRLQDNGHLNKELYKKKYLRVPRGRYPSDKIEEQALKAIAKANHHYRLKYNIHDNIIIPIPSETGFNVEINEEAIAEANQKIDDMLNEAFSQDVIENRMTEILFSRNEQHNISRDAAKTGKRDTETVETKLKKLIQYKKSSRQFLKGQLAKFNADLSNINQSDKRYDEILKIRNDIQTRIEGNRIPQGQEGYVSNLNDEIAELEKKQQAEERSIRYAAESLDNDIQRISHLLDTMEKDKAGKTTFKPEFLSYVNEIRLLLSVFDVYNNALSTKTHKYAENPVFTVANLDYIENENIPLEKKNVSLMNLYKKMNELNAKAVRYKSRLEKIEQDLIEDIAQNDEKIKRVYTPEQLTNDELFKPKKDIHPYDYLFSDGRTGTRSDLGPLPQLMSNLIDKATNKYMGKHKLHEERLNEINKKVNDELHRLGYGVGFFGKGKTGFMGVTYKLFISQNPDGSLTDKLVTRESAAFLDKLTRREDEYNRKKNTASGVHQIRDAIRQMREWRKKNMILVDPRKLKEIQEDPEFKMFERYFITDSNHKAELDHHLKSEKGYNKVVENQKKILRNYIAEYNRVVADTLEKYDKDSLQDLDVNERKEIQLFEARNNPFIAAKIYKANMMVKVGGVEQQPTMNRYNDFIPRRYKITNEKIDGDIEGERDYQETTEETGYYDGNFELIENNDVLDEFYGIADEIMDSVKLLSPEKQRELRNKALLGHKKTFAEILLDPEVNRLRRISPAIRAMFDTIKDKFQESPEESVYHGAINIFDRTIPPKVRSKYVNSNRNEINQKFDINGSLFISVLGQEGRKYMMESNKKLQSREVKFRKTTAIPISVMSQEAKQMVAEWLNCEPNDIEIMEKAGVGGENTRIPVGRILEKSVISQIAIQNTFNLPKMLKLYSLGAATYAAKNEVEPLVNILNNNYQQIKRLKINNLQKEVVSKIKGEELEEGENVHEEGNRKRANTIANLWIRKNLYGETKNAWGLSQHQSRGQMKSYEKKMWDDAQEVIDAQMKLPEAERDQLILNRMTEIQNGLGKRYAASAAIDTLILNPSRWLGLALNLASMNVNYIAGKYSNWINAITGHYYTTDSFWRAERVVLGSHLKMMTPSRVMGLNTDGLRTKGSRKAAIMMSRFGVFQDASDEIYKSSVNTALKFQKNFNWYFLQQRAEYVNQTPVLVAMLMDKKIQGTDSNGNTIESSVWDALDEHGKLKAPFNTPENKKTWEQVEGNDYDLFKSKVDTAIKNIHGDYTTLGAPVHSTHQAFRATFMFKRWMFRYMHNRYAVKQPDSELGDTFQGRFFAHTSASLAVTTTVMAFVMFGLNPIALGGGVIAGAIIGDRLNRTRSGNRMKDATMFARNFIGYFSKAVGKNLTNPIRLPMNLIAGKSVGDKTKFSRLLNEANYHETDEQKNRDLKANLTELSIGISAMMIRVLGLIAKNFDDDDEDKDRKFGALNYIMNLCGEVYNDITTFYNLPGLALNLLSPAPVRMVNNLKKLIDAWDEYDEEYVYGPYKGQNKLLQKTQKTLMPSALRTDFGFYGKMNDVYQFYGIEQDLEKQSKTNRDVSTQYRGNLRSELIEMYNDQLGDAKDTLYEAVAKSVMERRPGISHDKALRIAKGEVDAEIESRVNKYVNLRMPTSSSLYKENRDLFEWKVRQDHPDLEDPIRINNKIRDEVKNVIEENKKIIDDLRKEDLLFKDFTTMTNQ